MNRHLLVFSSSWCGPCKRLAKSLEQIRGQVSFAKIDIDSNKKTTQEYGVRSVPTIVLLENGNELTRTTGFKTPQQLIDLYES